MSVYQTISRCMAHDTKPITLRYLFTFDEYRAAMAFAVSNDSLFDLEVALNLFKVEALQHGVVFGYHVDVSTHHAGKWEDERTYPDTYCVVDLTFYDADLATKFKLSCDRPSLTIH
jgi:hypothetical protein